MRKTILCLLASFLFMLPDIHIAAGESSPKVKWQDTATSLFFSVGLKTDGTVWEWGLNNYADGSIIRGILTENTMVPVQVKGLSDVKMIDAGDDYAIALKNDGTVWAWGHDEYGELGDGGPTDDGKWDSGEQDETYTSNLDYRYFKAAPMQIAGLEHIVSIAASDGGGFAIDEDGSVWYWGDKNKPYHIQNMDHVETIIDSSRSSIPFFIKRDKSAWYFDGQEFKPIDSLTNVKTITEIGVDLKFKALKLDGTVWSFHYDERTRRFATAVQEPQMNEVIDIQANSGGLLYLKKDGTVWADGSNAGGRLGIGSWSYEDVPTPIQIKKLNKITKISSHFTATRSMAIREDGTLWGWGMSYIGDGTPWWRTSPTWIKASDQESVPSDHLISIQVNGVRLDLIEQPIVQNSRTLVPLRNILEALGASVSWDNETSMVTARQGETTISLTIGSSTATVNRTSVSLDAPPILNNGTTLVPVRFISEAFGANVSWDENTETVLISM